MALMKDFSSFPGKETDQQKELVHSAARSSKHQHLVCAVWGLVLSLGWKVSMLPLNPKP